MVISDPTKLTYPCIIITTKVRYVDEFTISYKNFSIQSNELHKAPITIPGLLLKDMGELFMHGYSDYTVLSGNRFYSFGKCINIREYSRRILMTTKNRLKVQGLSFFIEHNDDNIRIPNIGNIKTYATLREWKNYVFYKERTFEKVGSKIVKL